jgi:hypothetical protein
MADRPLTDDPRPVPILVAWILAVVLIQAVGWASGLRGGALAEAVSRGTARVESWSVGEEADAVVRKAIRTQQDTLPFWATMAAIGDFLIEPGWIVARALGASVLFCGVAALRGRRVQFGATLAAVALVQGIWVLGLAVRTGLGLALGAGAHPSTSATLLLPAGVHQAAAFVALEQLDLFALLGWVGVALAGKRLGQVGWLGALTIVTGLWGVEAVCRMGGALLLGAGMRMTLIPDTSSS